MKPLHLVMDSDMSGTIQNNLHNKERKSTRLASISPYKVEGTRHAFILCPKEVSVNSESKAKYPLIHETGYIEKPCDISCIQNKNNVWKKITQYIKDLFMLQNRDQNNYFLSYPAISDEAVFHINNYISRHNFCVGGSKNPHIATEHGYWTFLLYRRRHHQYLLL
jgi:hypothetical protein